MHTPEELHQIKRNFVIQRISKEQSEYLDFDLKRKQRMNPNIERCITCGKAKVGGLAGYCSFECGQYYDQFPYSQRAKCETCGCKYPSLSGSPHRLLESGWCPNKIVACDDYNYYLAHGTFKSICKTQGTVLEIRHHFKNCMASCHDCKQMVRNSDRTNHSAACKNRRRRGR